MKEIYCLSHKGWAEPADWEVAQVYTDEQTKRGDYYVIRGSCPECGAKLATRISQWKYAKLSGMPAPPLPLCSVCGGEIGDPSRRYCSLECQEFHMQPRTCVGCNKIYYPKRTNQLYCAPYCNDKHKRALAEARVAQVSTCPLRGCERRKSPDAGLCDYHDIRYAWLETIPEEMD